MVSGKIDPSKVRDIISKSKEQGSASSVSFDPSSIVNQYLLNETGKSLGKSDFAYFCEHYVKNTRSGSSQTPYIVLKDFHRQISDALINKKRYLLVVVPRGHGKELSDDTPILTTKGWTTHGALQPGDYVFNPSGTSVKVLAVSEPSSEKMKITFEDGEEIFAHPNHEWYVYDRSCHKYKLVDTKFLYSQKNVGRSRFLLPSISALQFPESNLPVDPYTLGVWLGDGTSSAALICGSETDLAHILSRIPSVYNRTTYFVHKTTGVHYQRFGEELRKALRIAGVFGNKHIPSSYFLASESQRRRLLEGLVDTDGSIRKKTIGDRSVGGGVRFVGSNQRLVKDVAQLARSLGYRVNVTTRKPSSRVRIIRDVQDIWMASWTPHDGMGQGTLPRKVFPRYFSPNKIGIKSVEIAPDALGRCIQVDSEDGLYLAGRNLIPTHNSSLVQAYLAWMLGRFPDNKYMYVSSAEDQAVDSGRKIEAIIKSKEYISLFGDLVPDSTSSLPWNNLEKTVNNISQYSGASLMLAGIDSARIVGKHVHGIILDDVITEMSATSPTERKKIEAQLYKNLMPVLEPGGKLIVLGTTYSKEDLYFKLKDQWKSIQNDADVIWISTSIENPIWPEDFGAEELQLRIDAGGGDMMYRAAYLLDPSSIEGTWLQADWLHYVDRGQIPFERLEYHFGVDLAVSDKETSDYFVVAVVGRDTETNRLYLVDMVRDRMGLDKQASMLTLIAERYNPVRVTVESNAWQKLAVDNFLANTNLPIYRSYSTVKKEKRYTRISSGKGDYIPMSALFQQMRILIAGETNPEPGPISSLKPFVNEWLAAPFGSHDDTLDAVEKALEIFSKGLIPVAAVLQPGERTFKSIETLSQDQEPESIDKPVERPNSAILQAQPRLGHFGFAKGWKRRN